MHITFKHRGNFKYTEKFFSGILNHKAFNILNKYGAMGVNALSSATPQDTGMTADSWGYEIKSSRNGYSICWTNSHEHNGVPIAILIQYGHGTGTGGYVEGRDFINPAIRPVFDELAESLWEEVTNL